MSCRLASTAYEAILSHAARHPDKDVVGVLLSPLTAAPLPAAAASDDNDCSATTSITHAVPLLHHWTSLSAIFELALELTALWADKNQLRVSGLYYASAKNDSKSIPPHIRAVASAIRQKTNSSLVAVLIPERLTSADEPALDMYDDPEGKRTIKLELEDKEAHANALRATKEGRHRLQGKGDFDDHCQDGSIDWLP